MKIANQMTNPISRLKVKRVFAAIILCIVSNNAFASFCQNLNSLNWANLQLEIVQQVISTCIKGNGQDINAPINAEGQTLLHVAAANTFDTGVILELVQAGASLDALDRAQRSPLNYAISEDADVAIVNFLLQLSGNRTGSSAGNAASSINLSSNSGSVGSQEENIIPECRGWNSRYWMSFASRDKIANCIRMGADVRSKSDDGSTPLHIAAMTFETPEEIELLLNSGAHPDARDIKQKTPLHYAIEKASAASIHALLYAGANPNAKDRDNRTPLHYAAANAPPDIIQSLIFAGANADIGDNQGRTALHEAALNSVNPIVAKLLVEAGADPNITDAEGRTPLDIALNNNSNSILVGSLLKANPEMDSLSENTRKQLFNFIAKNRATSLFRDLLNGGFDPNFRNDEGQTLLHTFVVAENESIEIVEALLNADADPNIQDHEGYTSLNYAVRHNRNPTIIRILLNSGSDPNLPTRDRLLTPLHHAASWKVGNPEVISMLLNAGSDPNARTDDYNTPLHMAAYLTNNADVIRLLLDAGAKIKAQNIHETTPLQAARSQNSNSEVIDVLKKAGRWTNRTQQAQDR